MNEKQQIEEMTQHIENHTCMSQFQAEIASRMLYQLGYRKQSEGEWEKKYDKAPRYVCSSCNHLYNNKEYKYCPNCGSKMKGGEGE